MHGLANDDRAFRAGRTSDPPRTSVSPGGGLNEANCRRASAVRAWRLFPRKFVLRDVAPTRPVAQPSEGFFDLCRHALNLSDDYECFQEIVRKNRAGTNAGRERRWDRAHARQREHESTVAPSHDSALVSSFGRLFVGADAGNTGPYKYMGCQWAVLSPLHVMIRALSSHRPDTAYHADVAAVFAFSTKGGKSA